MDIILFSDLFFLIQLFKCTWLCTNHLFEIRAKRIFDPNSPRRKIICMQKCLEFLIKTLTLLPYLTYQNWLRSLWGNYRKALVIITAEYKTIYL